MSIEDTFSHIHASVGKRAPASKHILSVLAIDSGTAKATLPPHSKWQWDTSVGDYSMLRDLIELTYPDQFKYFNARMFDKGGFYRGNPARNRIWETESGKAEFTDPTVMSALRLGDEPL